MANDERCEVDENVTVKPGDGWVQDKRLWFVEELEHGGREARLVRWDYSSTVARLETHAAVDELLRADEYKNGWRRASSDEVERVREHLSGTPAADQLAGLDQRVREGRVRDEGRAVDSDRLAKRALATGGRFEVPAAAKSFWGVGEGSPDLHAPTADVSPVVTDHGEPVPDAVPQAEYFDGEVPGKAWDAKPHGIGVTKGSEPPRANAPMMERAGLTPQREVSFPHDYPGAPGHDPSDPGDCFTSDCRHGCGCYVGPNTSGDRRTGVDPFGECPAHPEFLAIKRTPMFRELMADGMAQIDAMRKAMEHRIEQNRRLKLAEDMEELGSRLIYEARELRRAAGISDEEHAAAMMVSSDGNDQTRSKTDG